MHKKNCSAQSLFNVGTRLLLLAFLLFGICLSSCNIKGLTNGYKKLTQQEKAAIGNGDFASTYINGRLYSITGTKLRQLVRVSNQSLVHMWVPHCTGAYCYSLQTFVDYAAAHNRQLFIVADSYEMDDIKRQLGGNYPIFIIDAGAYHSNLRMRYRKSFVKELVGSSTLPDSVLYGSNLFFTRDSLQRATMDILKP